MRTFAFALCTSLACLTDTAAAAETSAGSDDASFVIDDRVFHHTWATKTPLPSARSDMTATTVGDAIYLVGGCGVDGNVWSAHAYGPNASGYTCQGLTTSVIKYLPLTDTIYLFGGVMLNDTIVDVVHVYNIEADAWSAETNRMPDATTDLSAFVINNIVFLAGGYTQVYEAQTRVQRFEPSGTAGQQWTASAPMNQVRGDHTTVVAQGKAYAIGGFHHANNFNAPIAHIEEYDPASGVWSQRPGMGNARGDKAVAVLNGIVHVIGGESKHSDGSGASVAVETVEAYNPVARTWHIGGSIPTARFRFVAASHGDSIFIFGGQGPLQGTYDGPGSRYALVNLVEEYEETVTLAVSAATGASVSAIALLVALQALVQ